jgi:hypothetical protein
VLLIFGLKPILKTKEERVEFSMKIQKMKKTELCRNMVAQGFCKYG